MINPKTLTFTLLITAAMTLPLKAAEQCCQPCANGVLVGVTADSCGACIDLAEFIPGCDSANAAGCQTCGTGFYKSGKGCTACNITLPGCTACSNANICTACAADYTLKSNKCTSTAAATVNGLHCTIRYSGVDGGGQMLFIPNCLECIDDWNRAGCGTCAPGTTLTWIAGINQICK